MRVAVTSLALKGVTSEEKEVLGLLRYYKNEMEGLPLSQPVVIPERLKLHTDSWNADDIFFVGSPDKGEDAVSELRDCGIRELHWHLQRAGLRRVRMRR